MADSGFGALRQLERMPLVVTRSAQKDRLPGAIGFAHPQHVDEERQTLVRFRREQFDVSEMGDILDRFWCVGVDVIQWVYPSLCSPAAIS
jgi:hypothetical protein